MRTVKISELTIHFIRKCLDEHSSFQIHNPGGELFQHEASEISDQDCLLVDVQSANLMIKIHDSIKLENREKFGIMMQQEYWLANFMDKM